MSSFPTLPPLIAHVERFLGRIEEGWSRDADGKPLPFQIVRTRGPTASSVAFSTLGLSNVSLQSRASKRNLHLELILTIKNGSEARWIPAILQQVATEVVRSGNPILRGDLVGPRDALFPNSNKTALYAAPPVCLPEAFASCELRPGLEVAYAWLVPVSSGEAKLIEHHGWNYFEDCLEREDPDLLDVQRPDLDAVLRAVPGS